MAKILITGGTGLIGTHLSHYLSSKGHEIHIATRRPLKVSSPYKGFLMDTDKGFLDGASLDGVEYIVNLAGEGIADQRWTDERMKTLISSRTQPIHLVTEHVLRNKQHIKGLVGASAIGYYGAVTVPGIFKESDVPGNDLMAKTCVAWEQAYKDLSAHAERSVLLRIGVVLTPKGGALKKMSAPFKIGFGAALGSGDQYMPWIHMDDLVRMIHDSLFGNMASGVYNAVASEHVTNQQFSQKLAEHFGKKLWLPNVPAFALKLAIGEMAVMLLEGSRVSNEKIVKAGFEFSYNSLQEALSSEA